MAAWWMKGPVGREMRLSASHFALMAPPLGLFRLLRLPIRTYGAYILVMCTGGMFYSADAVTLKTLYISQQTNRESNTPQPIPHIHIYRNRANELTEGKQTNRLLTGSA